MKERIENAIYRLGLNEFIFVSESKSTNSVYIDVCGFEVRISDHSKKDFLGNVSDLDIAEEILSAIIDIEDILRDEGAEEEKILAFSEELRRIAKGINSRRANLEKARQKKVANSLLAIEQAREILKSSEVDFLRKKDGSLIIGRELSFYRFLKKKKGIKILKDDAYSLYREFI